MVPHVIKSNVILSNIMGIVSSYFVKPQDADSSREEASKEAKKGDEASKEAKERNEGTPPLHPNPPRISYDSKNLRWRYQARRNKKKNK